MDELLLTALVQQNHPRVRRHTTAGLTSFLKGAVGNAFMTFFEQTIKTKPSLKDNQEMIKSNFQKINQIVDSVHDHISKRLQNHQNQIFSIVKSEIEGMKVDTQKLVDQLNKKITEKNIHNQLWHVTNELDYFKIQTLKLFDENKQFRLEIKLLKNHLKDLEIQLECRDQTMQKLRKKYLKEKFISSKAASKIKQKLYNSSNNLQKSQDLFKDSAEKISMARKTFRDHMKTEQNDQSMKQKTGQLDQVIQDKKQQESLIDIRLSNYNQNNSPVLIGSPDEPEIHIERNSALSISFRQSMLSNYLSELPNVNLMKVESFLQEQKQSVIPQPKYTEKAIQTEPASIHYDKIINKNNQIIPLLRQQIDMNNLKYMSIQKKIDFSNRFSFNKSVGQKQKKLQHSMRHRQTFRYVPQEQKQQGSSMRQMSNVFIKNKMQKSKSHLMPI